MSEKAEYSTTDPPPLIFIAVAQTTMSEFTHCRFVFHMLGSWFPSLFFYERIPLDLNCKIHFLQTSFSLINYR